MKHLATLAVLALHLNFPEQVSAQEYGTSTAPLITEEGITNWTTLNSIVPVCWETSGYEREKKIVQRAVQGTWQFWANVNFKGWAACPTTGDERHVRVSISSQDQETNLGAGGQAAMGTASLSKASDNDPGVRFSFAANTAVESRVQYAAVHEFGHVLGFGHEQDASDNEGPGSCKPEANGNANAQNITPYDRDSVMNYCNHDGNTTGHITFSDIKGVQKIYGVRRHYSAIRGVLLAGKFRTHRELGTMSASDQRNTLIIELTNRTKDSTAFYQSQNDVELSGIGAQLVYFRETGARSDQEIKTMSADDIRNTFIVAASGIPVSVLGPRSVAELQSMGNLELAQQALRDNHYISGVLLFGKFRSRNDLLRMTNSDQRNTLIAELAKRTKDSIAYYQSLANDQLAGAGSILVYMRRSASRTDQEIKAMTSDDLRNTLIVGLNAEIGYRIEELQSLGDFELALVAMIDR
jgi:Dual-action HEIGH metallo-peptidase